MTGVGAIQKAAALPGAATMDADYLARFGGIGRLYGRAALERMHAAHVCIVGIGGVGSWVVEALADSPTPEKPSCSSPANCPS